MARSAARDRLDEAAAERADHPFEPPARLLTGLLAARERLLLDRLCRLAPDWITPDRLTAIGAAGMVIAALGYVASRWRPEFLFLASLGLVINWFGDSLDGSLARFRGVERPRYGYFLDHSVDALGSLMFALGLGLSPYVSMSAALLLLCSYYLLTIHVLLMAQVQGAFPLAKVQIGPTELRLLAIAFNLFLFGVGPRTLPLAGTEVSIGSGLVMLEAVVFIAVFAFEALSTARRLAHRDDARRPAG